MTIYTKIIFVFFIILVLFNSCKKESGFNENDWELTFNDEFSDSILNRNVWTSKFPWGQSTTTNDQELFIDSAFSIKNGILNITAKRDTFIGNIYDGNSNPVQKAFYFSSGLIHTRNSFSQQYGYFEIRSRIPYGKGYWPAFWMMPYSGWPPEIDIYEIDGKKPNALLMTNHFRDNSGTHRQNSFTFLGPDFTTDFHKFAIEWNPNEIIWYLDDQKIYSSSQTGIPNERMYLVLSMTVGGNLSGDADQSTPLLGNFEIDYIRVYKKK
jgi:beta-glucanase (GH16 family)